MSRNRYGGLGNDPYANGNGNESPAAEKNDYDPYGTSYGDRYGTPPARTSSPPAVRAGYTRNRAETVAEKQIGQVIERIQSEWPIMCSATCVPAHVALQLLDTSSVGRAHEFKNFERMHKYLQDSLKAIVHEHHQGFNSSIGTFHKIQHSIGTSQKKVRSLKDSLLQSKLSLGTTDPELKKMANASKNYDKLIHTLSEIEELRLVPDQLEARISEKRFLTAVDILQNALRRIRVPSLDDIGALNDLRSYLANQEITLMDVLIEELHQHLYLQSPYCQERWQMLAKGNGAVANDKPDKGTDVRPFYEVLDSMDLSVPLTEDPSRNPESDTFYYIGLLIEALNKLGRLETAISRIKERLPVELFNIVNDTNVEVDQKHPSSLRGGFSTTHGNQAYGKENGISADVIYDLLWTLYAKFEAVAEGHRVLHDIVKSVVRREGVKDSTTLLGSFRELWTLYQNEIKSLLHSYVTTDADVYEHTTATKPGATSQDAKKEKLFQFSDADSKSVRMTAEYQDLDGIIRTSVPGLMSSDRKHADGKKQNVNRSESTIGSRRIANTSTHAHKAGSMGAHKSLVDPSVFNMSLLLPPTLGFLQRLKLIVPPGSEIVTSTLTSFLDIFLLNSFLPQLEETLGKLSDTVFEESDAFQQDSQWTSIARRPIFKGTSAFFALITAFCRMLDTIPHDQALSQLIINQMLRYYNRCYDWYKSLVSSAREAEDPSLKFAAIIATESGDIHNTIQKLWTEDDTQQNLEKETGLLILQTNEVPLRHDEIITDREIISSLCVLYTSMKWLAIKIDHLRHITDKGVDSSRRSMQQNRRWTLSSTVTRTQESQGPVYLPMSQETVVGFDSIVSSYQELAGTVLLTLHMEIRCQIIHALSIALSPESAPYLLEQIVNDPDPQVLSLNADLVSYDETVVRFLREKEISFVRSGLGLLIDSFLVTNAGIVKAMNANGCGRMQLNILVLQQNLKNIESDISLDRAARFFNLFLEGPDAIVTQAKEGKEKREGGKDLFNYDELKTLIELCYSEQLGDPERGTSTLARRKMDEHLLQLSEYMWQS